MKNLGVKGKSVVKKSKPESDDKEQSQRFVEEARKIELENTTNEEFGSVLDVILKNPVLTGDILDKGVSRKKPA